MCTQVPRLGPVPRVGRLPWRLACAKCHASPAANEGPRREACIPVPRRYRYLERTGACHTPSHTVHYSSARSTTHYCTKPTRDPVRARLVVLFLATLIITDATSATRGSDALVLARYCHSIHLYRIVRARELSAAAHQFVTRPSCQITSNGQVQRQAQTLGAGCCTCKWLWLPSPRRSFVGFFRPSWSV